MKSETADCGIPNTCDRIVPLWLVLLDNVPTGVLFVLGAVLTGAVWWPLAIFMTLYNLSAIALFWVVICRYCQHFATRACPCGYGVIAARYLSRKEGGDFGKIFRKNIAIMYPSWFIPFAAGIYLLFTRFSAGIITVFSAFIIVGFLIIPMVSRFIGCKGCTLKEQCPWMSISPVIGRRKL
jgi:hypothetical protein